MGIIVDWDVTSKCNALCDFCAKHHVLNNKSTRLNNKVIDSLVDKFKSLSVESVIIGGGEPLLVPRLHVYIRKLVDKGISVSVTTNGILLTEKTALLLVDSGVSSINISIDSMDANIHNMHRKINCFDKVKNGVANLLKACIVSTQKSIPWIGLSVTLMKGNLEKEEDIEKFFRYARANKIDGLSFAFVTPIGLGKKECLVCDGHYRLSLYEKICIIASKYPDIQVQLLINKIVYDYLEKKKLITSNIYRADLNCYGGESMLYLNSSLCFYPCHELFCDNEFQNGELKELISYEERDLFYKNFSSPDNDPLFCGFRKIKNMFYDSVPEPCKSCAYLRNCHSICRMHLFTRSKKECVDSWVSECKIIVESK